VNSDIALIDYAFGEIVVINTVQNPLSRKLFGFLSVVI